MNGEFRVPSRFPAVDMEPLGLGETPLGRAVSQCGFHPKDVLCVSVRDEGVPCYAVQGAGRHPLAFALGSRLANPGLTLVVFADTVDLEDLASACGKNLDLTCVTPQTGLLPVAQAAGATFLCRTDMGSLASSLTQAMQHKGFSLVELGSGPPEVLLETWKPVWGRGRGPLIGLPVPLPEAERLALWERLL